jgi:hypothetical protein
MWQAVTSGVRRSGCSPCPGCCSSARSGPAPSSPTGSGSRRRTVRRDVERLHARLSGACQPGCRRGYQLGPGQDLPPLLLDDEEAIATAVSLLAGDAALRALTKLDRVLPNRLRHEVRAFSGLVESYGETARRSTPRCS